MAAESVYIPGFISDIGNVSILFLSLLVLVCMSFFIVSKNQHFISLFLLCYLSVPNFTDFFPLIFITFFLLLAFVVFSCVVS